MIDVAHFIYGLAFFSLGFAALLEMRESSELALGRQLPWLAAFGLTHSAVEWSEMFLLGNLPAGMANSLGTARIVLLELSALLLIRFGIGLITYVGPLPSWVTFARATSVVPLALVIAYALISVLTDPEMKISADIWSRYLLLLPGGLLTAIGFARHWYAAPHVSSSRAYRWLLVASVAALVYAVLAGLIVPAGEYGLAHWINTEAVEALTGVPVPLWRAGAAILLTIAVIRALGVFAAERRHQLQVLEREHQQAQYQALVAQSEAREAAEHWIAAQVQISRQIAMLEPLDDILARIVERARVLLSADWAALGLWDEQYSSLIVKAVAGVDESEMLNRRISEGPLLDAVLAQRAALLREGTRLQCALVGQDMLSAAIAPLTFEGETLGVLWVASTAPMAFTPAHLDHVEHLSDQAVIAIQHALMAGRLQSLAVVEERARIAREMHDGLAQLLGYLSLEVQTIEALVRQGEVPAALDELKEARAQINAAQGDVRENILSLRTTLAGDAGLIQSLEQYAAEFSIQTGINAQFVNDLEEPPALSSLAETQLVCIVQEALANVRKHAQAGQVQIRLMARNGCLHATITDDGVGFVPRTIHHHFGLQTMRERSQSVGGGLTITSAPSEGTQVAVWLPRLAH